MYSVLVVEDSKPIVRDIINKIKAVNAEISVIETAYDGDSALDLLKTLKPDILFTDIKLPLMDGLTLIQKAKSICPSLKCVIISGYDDFEFTHKALKLHVDEYILKPVDSENLKKIVTGLIHDIDHISIMKQEAVISNILNKSTVNLNNINLPKYYAFSIIRNGIIPKLSELITKNEVYESLGMMSSDGSFWVADTRLNCEKVIFYDLNRHSEGEIKKLNETIFHVLKKQHTHLNIIYSGRLSDIDHLNIQYVELSNNLSSMILLNKPGLYLSSKFGGNHSLTKLNTEMAVFRKKMESFVRNKLSDDFYSDLSRNIRVWEKNCYPVIIVRRFLLIILDEISGTLSNNKELILEEPNSLADRILSDCNSYRELEEKLYEHYALFINARNEKSDSPIELAERIEKYLRNNIYGNLTMQNISDEFRFSPSYISRLMKMYYNNSPMDYYNTLKIQESKRLITENHDMLVKDIAEILGFNDQHYFSKVFKMQNGLSPVDYRNKTV